MADSRQPGEIDGNASDGHSGIQAIRLYRQGIGKLVPCFNLPLKMKKGFLFKSRNLHIGKIETGAAENPSISE